MPDGYYGRQLVASQADQVIQWWCYVAWGQALMCTLEHTYTTQALSYGAEVKGVVRLWWIMKYSTI